MPTDQVVSTGETPSTDQRPAMCIFAPTPLFTVTLERTLSPAPEGSGGDVAPVDVGAEQLQVRRLER